MKLTCQMSSRSNPGSETLDFYFIFLNVRYNSLSFVVSFVTPHPAQIRMVGAFRFIAKRPTPAPGNAPACRNGAKKE